MNNTELKEKIEQMEKELAELKKAIKNNDEPKFERTIGETYYYIDVESDKGVFANCAFDIDSRYDESMFIKNNYFHTENRANEVAEKIKILLKLERLHDIYCSDYNPDFNDTHCLKHHVYYDALSNRWRYVSYKYLINPIDVYFQSVGIAKKVCEILNAERKEENKNVK